MCNQKFKWTVNNLGISQSHVNPKTVFWTNVGKIVLIYFFKKYFP